MNTCLEAFSHGEKVVEFLLGQVDASLVDEVQDMLQALDRDAAKVQHDGHRPRVGVESGLFLEEGPQDRGGGREDELVSSEGLGGGGAVRGVRDESDVEGVVWESIQ